MTDRRTRAPYGTWRSPIDAETLFNRPSSPRYPQWHDGCLYWLEARAREGGRIVLMRRAASGAEQCLTPEGFSIRSRMHEYGGRCFALGAGCVYFCNDNDQRIYVQELDVRAIPAPLTPAELRDGRTARYADLKLAAAGGWLCFAMERQTAASEHPVSSIAALPPRAVRERICSEPQTLAEGSDFYADPVISPDERQLAWLQWQHPCMPWDESNVCMAQLRISDELAALGPSAEIAGGEGSSVCQIGFADDGRLLFMMDKDGEDDSVRNYWNLYAFGADGAEAITSDRCEYGAPHWVFGASRYARFGPGRLLCICSDAQGDRLLTVDLDRRRADPLTVPGYNDYADVAASRDGAVLLTGRGPLQETTILKISGGEVEKLKQVQSLLPEKDISVAQAIVYPTSDGEVAHGYFYPPKNHDYAGEEGDLPPLLVMVHGGPTARTTSSLELGRQYWTTRGFAVLDVNHRGSTGYGRRYRQSLLGAWGVKDAADVAAAVDFLVSHHKVDPAKICIRGGSAGGYLVLRVLTEYPHLFNAGACYYGIGNLATLAATTHKFELKYTDRLIGEDYDPEHSLEPDSRYYQRSPIHYMDRLRCPMIVFQGSEDKVVPPALAQEIVVALKAQGIRHEYVEYPGEGHGFRRSETGIDARRRETAFFMDVLGLEPCRGDGDG